MSANPKSPSNYPRHSLDRCLRIPEAILGQNAGKPCTIPEAGKYLGITNVKGPFTVEINSAIKFCLLSKTDDGNVELTTTARKILRPQSSEQAIEGMREAILCAPGISDVYTQYRGENLPDDQFFDNALIEKFKIPEAKIVEFKEIFIASLRKAELLVDADEKLKVVDISYEMGSQSPLPQAQVKSDKALKPTKSGNAFVMMPFAEPHGSYYEKIYKPAIEKAGMTPVRADSDIFGAGKIVDQIWTGIKAAAVLVAELTTRNPNVFYELGLAHALKKPVVLVSSNEGDVPFDLKHVRVIYYDVSDPFWGQKLIDKVSENIQSAMTNPNEAILFPD